MSRGWEARVGCGDAIFRHEVYGWALGSLRMELETLAVCGRVKAFPQHPFNKKSLPCVRHMVF